MADFATVAIDGPAASGKTTVGRLVAKRLGARFLDTGLMYRAVTVAALDRGVDYLDDDALKELVSSVDIRFELDCADLHVEIEGSDVTPRLKEPEVDHAVSPVATSPSVRHAMVARQRAMTGGGAIVMAGRDIGTVVLPNATVKVYLDAEPAVRAARRRKEMQSGEEAAEHDEVLQGIRSRDQTDSQREMSPLRPADDAVRIDTNDMTVDEVAGAVVSLVDAR